MHFRGHQYRIVIETQGASSTSVQFSTDRTRDFLCFEQIYTLAAFNHPCIITWHKSEERCDWVVPMPIKRILYVLDWGTARFEVDSQANLRGISVVSRLCAVISRDISVTLWERMSACWKKTHVSWWRHQMETFSALLAICTYIFQYCAGALNLNGL